MRQIGFAAVALVLCACVAGTRGHGPEWVGQPAGALINREGMPERQMTAPSGATVYVYTRRNLHGDSLCDEQYFLRDDKVIGFLEQGIAVNCSGQAGVTN